MAIWAAGGGPLGQETVILHWNGTSWSQLTSQGSTFRGGVDGLAAISADDIWAVGYRGTPGAGVPQILHWNGTIWTRMYGPATTGGFLENNSGGPYPPPAHRCE